MTYLLDTNVVSELRRPDKANSGVRAFAAQHGVDAFYLSAVTVLEIELGIVRLEQRDRLQSRRIRDWFEQKVLSPFNGRILAFDTEIARCCAQFHVPNPVPERDAMIAATAIVRRLVVVTRNVKDFTMTGVAVLDPSR